MKFIKIRKDDFNKVLENIPKSFIPHHPIESNQIACSGWGDCDTVCGSCCSAPTSNYLRDDRNVVTR